MRIFNSFFIIILINIANSSWIAAQTEYDKIFRFLEMPSSAQASALGGNHVAIFRGNSSLMHINPAYLDEASQKKISASFINYLGDTRYGYTNYALNFSSVGSVGFGLRFLSYGDLTKYDDKGNDLGKISATDLALNSTISTQLSNKMRAAAGVDYVYSSYAGYVSSAIVGSAGLYYLDVDARFSAGISIRNVGDQIVSFNNTNESIPLDISIGISKKPQNFPFQLSVTFRQLNNWNLKVQGEENTPDFVNQLLRHIILGGEASLSKTLTFRIGYNRWLHDQARTKENFDFAGTSIGVGIKLKKLDIDISRSSLSEIGGIVQFSLRMKTY